MWWRSEIKFEIEGKERKGTTVIKQNYENLGQISSVSILRSFNLEEQFSNLQFRIARETVAFTLVKMKKQLELSGPFFIQYVCPRCSVI